MQWYSGRATSLNKINLWISKPAEGISESVVQER